MKVEDFLEMFNNGELEVEKYFNDYETWFNILKSRGLMSEVDPHNATDSEDWQNQYLLWLYDNDREKYYKWVGEFLNDIEIDVDTKKIYWVGEREDLSGLFCDGNRYDISQKTIRSILGDGDAFEPYWDTTDNLYRDVIEELDEKNINRLKERIIKDLQGQKLSPETEEMELIASEQGHDDYWEMNSTVVTRIIDDEESMNYLLDDELGDLKSDLYQLHANAYNSAYETEVYDDIFSELNTYFEGKGEWYSVPHPSKENTEIQKYKIPISDFEGVINDYLFDNKGWRNGTIEYHGSFLWLLREHKDCLTVRISDYADPRLVDKNINIYFDDYI